MLPATPTNNRQQLFAAFQLRRAVRTMLQSVPPCFVGPVANLEAVVKLLSEQMTATFKQQALPVPPWRTHAALMSKWSPSQLAELAAKVAAMQRLSSDAGTAATRAAMVPCQSHDTLCNDDRPAAAHASHAAVGSAPLAAGGGHLLHAQPQSGGCTKVTAVWPVAMPQPARAGDTDTARTPVQLNQGGLGLAAAPQASAAAQAALLSSAVANDNGTPLKFTRKASAEWKHQRSNRKIKGLLAAALKKSPKTSSRSNLGFSGGPAVLDEEHASAAAAAVTATGAAATADVGDALIRRTHFHTGRITTVRWAAGVQQPQQQQQMSGRDR